MKWRNKAGERAFAYHSSGYHCAEAVSRAIVEEYGGDTPGFTTKTATPFGGGIGRTHDGICGALSGGIIALGWLFGRSEPGEDCTDVSQRTEELIQHFIREHGTTQCGKLLDAFGPQENMQRCKLLSGETADLLADLIEKRHKI